MDVDREMPKYVWKDQKIPNIWFITNAFDPTLSIVVASDASDSGIGSVTLYKYNDGTRKPVAHASRSFKAAEKNYCQIEKEALAIIFAMKKFRKFQHGREFFLQTDHRLLLSISGS